MNITFLTVGGNQSAEWKPTRSAAARHSTAFTHEDKLYQYSTFLKVPSYEIIKK